MSGPEVTHAPAAKDGRTVIVKLGSVVHQLKPLEARALSVRLGRVLDQLVPPAEKPQGMSGYHRRRLHAMLREVGAEGDDRFPVLSQILGREITSTNEMDDRDAERCYSALGAMAANSNGPEHERTRR